MSQNDEQMARILENARSTKLLNKLEEMSLATLNGLLSNPGVMATAKGPDDLAVTAVGTAVALLKALDGAEHSHGLRGTGNAV